MFKAHSFVNLDESDDFKICNSVVCGIFHRFGDDARLRQFSRFHRTAVLVWQFSGILDNGGFHYLFEHKLPGDPNFRLLLKSFTDIGFDNGATAMAKALALFPGGRLSRSRDRRLEIFDAIPEKRREKVDDLWFANSNCVSERLAAFIRSNRREFENLPAHPPKFRKSNALRTPPPRA